MIIIWRNIIMAKLFIGKVKVDDQVSEFDMSELAEGKLTLPTGAVKNISEISDAVKVGALEPQAGGEKLVQEKHLKAVEAAAEAAISVVEGDLASEVTRATGEEARIEGKVDGEIARATGEEARIEGKHDAYVTSNNAALAAEVQNRIDGDTTLQGNIDALSGAVAADFSQMETDFVAALGAEESARISGDSALQSAIDTEKGRIDAMLSGSTVDFDTLKEIVDAYQLADTDIVTSIVTLDGKVDTEIADRIADVNAEETRALAAEAVLQTNINNEATARQSADANLQTAINNEATARANAVSAEETARIAADGVLQGNIDAEETARIAGDDALAADLAQELLDRAAGDVQALADAKAYTDARETAEATARSAADATLQGNIDALSGAVAADFASMETDFLAEIGRVESESDAAEATLTANLAQELLDRAAGDTALQGNIDAEEAARIAADGVLQGNIDALSSSAAAYRSGMETFFAGELATLQADVDQNEADADAAILAEETRALAAEGVLQGNIDAEEAARISGDAGLQAQINDILSNTDPAALDSLSEIVAAFQSADSDLNDAITAALGTHTSELNAFSGAVASDFAALQADVDQNELDGDNDRALIRSEFAAADALLQTAVDDEEARALAAEAVLAASITTEEAARIAGDATLQGNIDALSGAVESTFSQMETDFVAEIARVESESDAAEATLTANLAAEVTRAQGEEARIEAKHDAHFDGFVKVAYLTEADSAMGAATHYIVNASAPKSFTLPVMTEEYFIMVKVAEGSSSVTFSAAGGESIDGETDGNVVLHGGSSAMFVKKGGVMYLF